MTGKTYELYVISWGINTLLRRTVNLYEAIFAFGIKKINLSEPFLRVRYRVNQTKFQSKIPVEFDAET